MTSVTCFWVNGADVARKTWRSLQRQVRFGHIRAPGHGLLLLDVGSLGSNFPSLGDAVEHVSKL